MPTNTTNFNLIKPIQGEFYNVDVPNSNMDTIDGVLKVLQDAINAGASEQELDDLRQALTTHLADNVKHISESERTNWNGKAPTVHTHTIAQVTGLQNDLDSKIDESMINVPNGVIGLDASGNLPSGIIQGQFKKVLEFDVGGQATFSIPNLSSYEEFEIVMKDLISSRPTASNVGLLITSNDDVTTLGQFSGTKFANNLIGGFNTNSTVSTSTLVSAQSPGTAGPFVINSRLKFKKLGYNTWQITGVATFFGDHVGQNAMKSTDHILGSFGGVSAQLNKLTFKASDVLPFNSGRAELWVKN